TADSARLVQSNALPDLQIDGHDSHSAPQESGFMHFVHGAEAVVSDLARGAADEVVHHPGQVIGSALTGLAIGTVAVLAAPEIAIAAAVAGVGYGAYELATHVGGWVHSADVVSNVQDHTAAEVAQAHQTLQGVGAGGVLIGAGVIGSLGAAPLAGAISEATGLSAATAASSAEGGTVSDVLTNAVRSGRYETVELPNGMTYLRPVQGSVPMLEGPATTAALEGPAAVPLLEGPAAVPLLEGPATAGISRNQSIFQAAQERGEVVPSVKQLYSVQFERVGPEGRLVPTLENPAGVQLQEGSWVATRLNADGTPNIENGMVNQWTPSAKEIGKQYVVTPEQLESSNFVAQTNVNGNPVHMVQLDAPMDFQTPWGPMHADAGDWLSNYDFNTTTGQAGTDFARVTARSYQQTYRPVTPQD
ncbi:MAG: hypothetical protein HYX67_08980, partial [Candidatus Melainabacteria bacterium]|nr:hypothetical protein [Candidatus Melainabacteria bacterium]